MSDDKKVAISNIISAVRAVADMTQKEFGEHLGVTAKQVRRYEGAESTPPQSRLKRLFHIGLKIAAPIVEQLPYYAPAVLTLEVINEIRENVRKEHEQEASEKARIEELSSEIAAKVEKACQARDDARDKGNQG